jgi:outer membrane lipoprotein carrier protein
VPTAMADRVEQILLEVTPESRIVRIRIQQVDGSTTEYRFSQPRENLELADQRFSFTLPVGVEVVDGDFGQ